MPCIIDLLLALQEVLNLASDHRRRTHSRPSLHRLPPTSSAASAASWTFAPRTIVRKAVSVDALRKRVSVSFIRHVFPKACAATCPSLLSGVGVRSEGDESLELDLRETRTKHSSSLTGCTCAGYRWATSRMGVPSCPPSPCGPRPCGQPSGHVRISH